MPELAHKRWLTSTGDIDMTEQHIDDLSNIA